MRHLLRVDDLDRAALEALLERSLQIAQDWEARAMPRVLQGRRIGLIAELPGWRNPTAVKLGAAEMGAICVDTGVMLEGGEAVGDLAGYLGNWCDLMAVRTPRLSRLAAFAEAAAFPVLNLRTNDNHPCEILGDLAFVLSRKGHLDGLKVVVAAPNGNIVQSWLEAARVVPISVTQWCPVEQGVGPDALPPGCDVTQSEAALLEADVIVTDCWSSTAGRKVAGFSVTGAILERCRPDVYFIPCPPVTRGEEVDAAAMAHASCVATQAKAYLMHVQNAAMVEALT
ncbi:ornithine carbamoyltransferase [Shimia isoporae]|uniref:Ornithine carbamoyltransferase n=1 Tax=Shimia isoporae TaxID=647720 RepID=A0A4R1N9Q7_9RHOB|nr:ornithine carbamoyltransferase [Shimia isoporae]TCL00532.1 ornithine carbamoyltransferase [Shimia isoporae]